MNDVAAIVEAVAQLLIKLIPVALEYVDASEERKAELRAKADADYAACKARVFSLDAAIEAGNAAADAAAAAKRP
jgi:hypothetical protein